MAGTQLNGKGMFVRSFVIAIALATAIASSAEALDPASSCQAAKLKIAGKYDRCRLSADSKAVKSDEAPDYTRCTLSAFPEAEERAEGACPSNGDDQRVRRFLDACTQSVREHLAAGTLGLDPETCGSDLSTCTSDCDATRGPLTTGQTACYGSLLTPVDCSGTGQDGELQRGTARSFIDNGNGTITEEKTNLMWEKLSHDGSIHDRDAEYVWMDAFEKIAELNSSSFAGHDDWRLPNISELQTMLSYDNPSTFTFPIFDIGCMPGCTVTDCSCTGVASTGLWSSTSSARMPSQAFTVYLSSGTTQYEPKTYSYPVRAVRRSE
jgi:hypothetical protein